VWVYRDRRTMDGRGIEGEEGGRSGAEAGRK
jgi:hypothetical protein